MTELVDRLKAEVLPELFKRPASIGEYGASPDAQAAMDELGDLMEGAPVTRLATRISEIVAKLADADPKRIAKQPTRLDVFLGRNVEVHVRYQVARKKLDELLLEAEVAAQGVRDAIGAIELLMLAHAEEANLLRCHIQAGQEFLAENPAAGKPLAGAIEFDNPRERFARKLANMNTLLSSHEMSVTQMKLAKAQAVDMLDRFEETSQMLVPVWRQHTLALTTSKNMSSEMVAEATKAHDALMRSLAQSMSGLKR